MSRYTYTISSENAVSIFDSENPNETGAPNLYQPVKPQGGAPFASEAEAQAWAELTIDSLLNPENYIPTGISVPLDLTTPKVSETPAES